MLSGKQPADDDLTRLQAKVDELEAELARSERGSHQGRRADQRSKQGPTPKNVNDTNGNVSDCPANKALQSSYEIIRVGRGLMLTSLDQVGLLADFFSSFAHEVLDRNQPAPDTKPGELFVSLPGDVLHSFSTALKQTIHNSRNPIHTFEEKYQEAQPMRESAELRVLSTLPADTSSGLAPSTVSVTFARRFMGLNTEDIGRTIQQLLRQLLVTLNTLLKMPDTIEGILTRLETGQFVINLGGDIGVGATAFRRRERDGATTAFPLALAGMFVASVGGAFLFDSIHDPLLAIVSLILAAILGIRLFFRW